MHTLTHPFPYSHPFFLHLLKGKASWKSCCTHLYFLFTFMMPPHLFIFSFILIATPRCPCSLWCINASFPLLSKAFQTPSLLIQVGRDFFAWELWTFYMFFTKIPLLLCLSDIWCDELKLLRGMRCLWHCTWHWIPHQEAGEPKIS